MKTGIIGLPQVGKTSLFKILTKAKLEDRGYSNPREAHIGVARVPDHRLDSEETIQIDGFRFDLLLCPGHCPGSLCFHLAAEKWLFGGDVLFASGVGRWDLPGGSQEELIGAIRGKILKLPDDTKVFPGHGPATTVGRERRANPYLQ